jgi:hypothetical protein
MDFRGIPTARCICGSEWFYVPVKFDEGYEIAMWGLDGKCMECGADVTVCTPLDLPEVK